MLIDRPNYINELKSFKDQDLIKVVTGLRRSGKSTLFELYINYLKSTGVKDRQIIQMNFDNPIYDFKTAKDLYDYIIGHAAGSTEKTYVFLDEIQMVPEFQKAINGLRILPNFDIYITGSNAYLLSGELATLLSGRYIEIHMLPLSFKEYLTGLYPDTTDFAVLKRKINLETVFHDYLNFGSLPQTLNYYTEQEGIKVPSSTKISKYLENILSTIVYKDIMMRHSITDRDLLEKIVKFILDNIGQPISIKKIVDTLNGNQQKTSFYTIENYVSALEECFLIYKADRYDIRGRELLSTGYKYFVADLGLRRFLLGRDVKSDIGQMLENTIYLELIRRGKQVKVGKYDNLEVDFITNDNTYYQVSTDISNPDTLNRELAPLRSIKDNYPKVLLTTSGNTNIDGIEVQSIIDWLLSD